MPPAGLTAIGNELTSHLSCHPLQIQAVKTVHPQPPLFFTVICRSFALIVPSKIAFGVFDDLLTGLNGRRSPKSPAAGSSGSRASKGGHY
jgi:hypothetical protein